VGIALTRRFQVEENELLLVNLGDKLAGFTWLGRLQNLSLEGLLSCRGISTKAFSFSIHFRNLQPSDCLRVLRDLALTPSPENPLLDMPVEKVVDLGPYFDLLNEDQQRKARGDWFVPEALHKFTAKLERVRLVDQGCDAGLHLASLASV
jgi:hypothetical protein